MKEELIKGSIEMERFMTNSEIQEYTLRITQGNRTDLVVTTYDIILNYIKAAQNAYKDEDIEKFIWNIKRSQEFLQELMRALDLQYEISMQLMKLYRFVQQILIDCIMKKNNTDLDEIIYILQELKESFTEVAKQDPTGPVYQGAGQVYAGLTYGKGVLNETYEPTKNGFRA